MSARLKELENRIQRLEERVRMLVQIANSEKDEFIYFALEKHLRDAQIKAICDLMNEVSESLKTAKPMSHSDFEDRVYQIVPIHSGDYHFAEDIVRILTKKDAWLEVYEHMKKSGMNLK